MAFNKTWPMDNVLSTDKYDAFFHPTGAKFLTIEFVFTARNTKQSNDNYSDVMILRDVQIDIYISSQETN